MRRPDPDVVTELFSRACELPANRRAGFLDAVCKDDPELRSEVESLLEHDLDPPDILRTGGLPGTSRLDEEAKKNIYWNEERSLFIARIGVVTSLTTVPVRSWPIPS